MQALGLHVLGEGLHRAERGVGRRRSVITGGSVHAITAAGRTPRRGSQQRRLGQPLPLCPPIPLLLTRPLLLLLLASPLLLLQGSVQWHLATSPGISKDSGPLLLRRWDTTRSSVPV